MITAHDIEVNSEFEFVTVQGRAILPSDPMTITCGDRIIKLIKGADLGETIRKWDGQGRIIDRISPYGLYAGSEA